MSTQVINYGSINIDHVYRVPHFVQPGETLASQSLKTVLGGKGANQSVALARAGIEVTHLGQIADTDQWAKDILLDAGVNTDHIHFVNEPSGHAIIQVDDQGENAIVLHGGANQTCRLNDLDHAIKENPDAQILLLQNECNSLAEAFELARKHQLKVALNPAPMSAAINDLPLTTLDVLIVNQLEAQALSGETKIDAMLASLTNKCANACVVITLGAQGAVLSDASGNYQQPGLKVDVTDTTGAGDTFVGYFIAGLIDQLDPQTNLARACHAAALSTTSLGAIPSIPAKQKVVDYETSA